MIIKRKYGNHSGWKRILQKNYTQIYVDSKEYRGYVTLLNVEKVTQSLWTKHGEQEICIIDDGYAWLQHFPENKHHSITTIFDQNGNIVQWYIDICLANGIEKDIPYMDDLFLDIIILPSGLVIEKDKDEIEQALSLGIISQELYELAWKEFDNLLNQIRRKEFLYLHLSQLHKENLAAKMMS